MKRSFILFGILSLALIASACRDGSVFPIDPEHHSQDSTSPAISLIPTAMIGKQWDLTSIENIDKHTAMIMMMPFTLTFGDASHLSGMADCNAYNADYTTKTSNGIAIANIVATKIACTPDDGAPEYMNGLRTATSFRITGSTLRIYFDSGRQVLNYMLHDAPPDTVTTQSLTIGQIAGTEWLLTSFEHLPTAPDNLHTLEPVPADQRFTLRFTPGADDASSGGAGGTANCNSYGSSYREGTNSLISIDYPIATMAACTVQANMESIYYNALQGAISYQALKTEKGELTLQISYDRGGSVLNFIPASSTSGSRTMLKDHFGENWRLSGYGPASGTLTNPTTYDGRTLVISFINDHTMTGTGYCSTFTGQYALQTYPGLVMQNLQWPTTTLCQESEGFMVDALQTMSSYVVNENSLQIYYHGRNDVMYFTKEQ